MQIFQSTRIEETLKNVTQTIHILVNTETWLHKGKKIFFYSGFFASPEMNRGGVVMYIHNLLNYNEIENCCSRFITFLEITIIEKTLHPYFSMLFTVSRTQTE